jgi:hypothetical protein
MELGNVQKAIEYAQKDLELTMCMIGTDDTEYLQGENGESQLQHWFRYLNELCDIY